MKDYEIDNKYEVCFGTAKRLLDDGLAKRINPYDNEFDIYAKTTSRTDDVNFFIDIAKKIGGEVLEIGCGEGRLLIPMLKAGIHVDGIDNSEKMIKNLNAKISDLGYDTNIELMDMKNITLEKKYKLIILSFGAIGYLKDDIECKKLFNDISNMLEMDGKFIFDFEPINDSEGRNGPFLCQQLYIEDSKELIVRTLESNGVDEERRVVNIINYIIKDGNIQIAVEGTVEKKYNYELIIKYLHDAGFKIDNLFEDYSSSLYVDKESEECIVVASKVNNSN